MLYINVRTEKNLITDVEYMKNYPMNEKVCDIAQIFRQKCSILNII